MCASWWWRRSTESSRRKPSSKKTLPVLPEQRGMQRVGHASTVKVATHTGAFEYEAREWPLHVV